MVKFTGDLRCDFNKATEEITKLKDRILGYQEQISSLRNEVNRLRRKIEADQAEHRNVTEEKDAIIKELQNRLAHAEALKVHDGTNTGMSTAKTPEGKKKVTVQGIANIASGFPLNASNIALNELTPCFLAVPR